MARRTSEASYISMWDRYVDVVVMIGSALWGGDVIEQCSLNQDNCLTDYNLW